MTAEPMPIPEANTVEPGVNVEPFEVSVVVVVGHHRERIARMVRALSDQSWDGSLEIVLVDTTAFGLDFEGTPRPVIHHVRTPAGTLPGRARYEGFLVSSGKVVAFLEDHCFPEPPWLESIMRRHLEPWAAVGYVFRNGSPDTYLTRSILMAEYGHWLVPADGGRTSRLPGCNVSYKRAALEQFAEKLGTLLESDFNLHQAVIGKGDEAYIESKAVVHHESYRRFSELLHSHLLFCRLQAKRRIEANGWGRFRRLAIGLLVPVLLPMLQVWRLLRSQGNVHLKRRILPALPVLFAICQFDAFGEALGCWFGEGNAAARFARYEIDAERATIDALY